MERRRSTLARAFFCSLASLALRSSSSRLVRSILLSSASRLAVLRMRSACLMACCTCANEGRPGVEEVKEEEAPAEDEGEEEEDKSVDGGGEVVKGTTIVCTISRVDRFLTWANGWSGGLKDDIFRDILRLLARATRSSCADRRAWRSCFNLASKSAAADILSSVPLRALVSSVVEEEACAEGEGGVTPMVSVPARVRAGNTDFHSL